MIYRRVFRPLLFRGDPERIHQRAIDCAEVAQRVPGFTRLTDRLHRVHDPRLQTSLAGIPLDNPIGLAAGYDKSGRAIRAMASLGFGAIEIGSISADPSAGNPKPRLWRLPEDEATCVYYGLPNDGSLAVAGSLKQTRSPVPLGINLVNTNRGQNTNREQNTNRGQCCGAVSADEILSDYAASAQRLSPHASYLMLNLSCPNTSDGREFFDEAAHLRELLHRLNGVDVGVPVFLKISPDGDEASVDRLLETVDAFPLVRGFMFNLSPRRRSGLSTSASVWKKLPGAVSGKPTAIWMNQKIADLYRRMDTSRYQIIAAGGVSDAEDAWMKMGCGASMVQLLTALIYRGPGVVKQINRGLVRRLQRDGIANVAERVGTEVR